MTLDAAAMQASGVPELSPWSTSTTPEYLWDTSLLTMTPVSGAQGLSTAARSPAISSATTAPKGWADEVEDSIAVQSAHPETAGMMLAATPWVCEHCVF